jgi:hypothetical protein
MKRTLVTIIVIAVAVLLFASSALPWGSATHAYIDDHLGLRGPGNLRELYGGMAPDIFNYLFSNPTQQAYLYSQTHAVSFLKVWNGARCLPEKPYAFGFVSHNDLWGADFTAHHNGQFFGQGKGYVIAKAEMSQGPLNDLLQSLGLRNVPGEATLVIAENLVENGIDILVKRRDPLIGVKVSSSALLRGPDFPLLLVKAFAGRFSADLHINYAQAARLITSNEMEFRKMMILYGQALTQDEATALQLVSQQLAELAVGFLGAYGISLPPGVDVADLTPKIQLGTQRAMLICAGDYLKEIGMTIQFVNAQLVSHGISY